MSFRQHFELNFIVALPIVTLHVTLPVTYLKINFYDLVALALKKVRHPTSNVFFNLSSSSIFSEKIN